MSAKHMTDMTKGSPIRLILAFAFPLMLSNIFQQMYNMVDSVVVGNFVGTDALAAVGACSSVNFFLISVSMGLATGVGVIVAQYFGANDEHYVRKTIANAVYVLESVALVTAALGAIFAPQLLRLLQTDEEVIADAITYMRISCISMGFIVLYNGVASILRALGDSKSPLYFLIISSMVNIVLDLVFVLVLQWGVFGVAFATLIAQMTSSVVSVIYSVKKIPYFKLNRASLRPDPSIIRKAFRIGIPIAMQSSMISISMMALQGVINSFGKTVTAAYAVAGKMDNLVSGPYVSVYHALTTYSGQNIGAGNVDRVKQGFRASARIINTANLVMVPLIVIFSSQIIRVFSQDAELIALGSQALKITGVCYIGLGLIYPSRGVMNGCGDASFSLINGIVEVACRILYSQVLTRIPFIGVWGIWYTSGLTWVTVAVVCYLRYRTGIWMTKSMMEKTAKA